MLKHVRGVERKGASTRVLQQINAATDKRGEWEERKEASTRVLQQINAATDRRKREEIKKRQQVCCSR
jgi:hypothetical protein